MNLSEIIGRAIEIRKQTGKIPFDQLNELIDKNKLESEDIERLLQMLSDEGIDVVET